MCDKCNLFPQYTPIQVFEGGITPVHCNRWILNNFHPLAAICKDCFSGLEYGDHVTDLNGAGHTQYVNMCWGCRRKILHGTLILVPHFCVDCKSIQSGRRELYGIFDKLNLLERVAKIASDDSETEYGIGDVYNLTMMGYFGDSINDFSEVDGAL